MPAGDAATPGEAQRRAGATHPPPWLRSYPADIDWSASIDTTPLPLVFDATVARFGTRRAIGFLGRHWTWSQVGDLVDRAARGLQSLGVGKGTKVGVYLPNTPYYVIAYYAVLKVGGTVVNLNPLYAKQEVLHLVRDSDATVLITLDVDVLYAKASAALEETQLEKLIVCRMSGILPFLKGMLFPLFHRADLARWKATERVLAFDDLTADKSGPEPVAIAADDLAVLQYTGGTTGTPKGAMLTHANIAANTSQLRLIVTGLQPGEERVLGLLPLSHVFAMTVVMNVAVSAGAEMILLPRFDLKGLLRTIHQQRPTVFPGVPTVYAAINEFPDLRRYDLSSIRYCISGGAALPPDVQARFEAITGCHLVEGYGLSETSPVAISNLLNGGSRAGSVGLPVPGTHVEIRSLEDRSVAQPPGEPGEIAIRGPQVMRGYWKRPDATAKALVDGWFFTGDVGHMDADGFTFLVDRIKDVIVRDGYKVYPRVIEEAIRAHPAVADVTVIGVPDAIRGAFPKAFVRLVKAGAVTVDELRSFLVERLSPLETPKEFEFRTRLPRTNVGKPARKELLEEELAARARGGG